MIAGVVTLTQNNEAVTFCYGCNNPYYLVSIVKLHLVFG